VISPDAAEPGKDVGPTPPDAAVAINPDAAAGLGDAGGVDDEWARWPVPPEAPTNYVDDNADGTVTDGITGLLWQQVVPAGTFDWADETAYCAGLSLGGRTGWRLPTAIELLSIVDSSRTYPAVNPMHFPNTPAKLFWTSTPCASYSGSVWYVDFVYGMSDFDTAAQLYSARCTWTGSPPAQVTGLGAPAGQYTISADTVKDERTGLIWQRAVPAQLDNWISIQGHCESLDLGGFASGWRLPTKKELETLVDFRAPNSGTTIDATAFPNTPAEFFWTSTPCAGTTPNQAWFVGFYVGDSAFSDIATEQDNARCVH
jgi:hypothetical protein